MASRFPFVFLNLCALFAAFPAAAQPAADSGVAPGLVASTLKIARSAGAISIDGKLDDPGWKGAAPVETWYETRPGDNTPPTIRSVGYLTFDDTSLYAAFEFDDPDPRAIRAPFGDRDTIGSSLDYGGVIIDPGATGRTAILFLANPRGIQYDAVTDDGSGEDSSPDFFWDSAARITDKGWTLEIRIPFSSIRYPKTEVPKWGIMLYRNYPRDFRYQMFSTRLPRSSNCFICNSNGLEGLQKLPSSGGIVVAPYVSAGQDWADEGTGELRRSPLDKTGGLDVKWRPSASLAVDGTVNPDFSQIESDAAQISTNERFALFYSEKRPFFLEGIELFSTPIQAVYTRTITSPRWGLRGTGKVGSLGYTALAAEDRGGGSVILPGPQGSDFADQEFRSWVGMARVKRDLGRSFVSALMVDREIEGGGSNRVFGPDFRWQRGSTNTVTGQLLWSQSTTPVRPDLASEWDGRKLDGHAAQVWWQHSSTHVDWFTQFQDIDKDFRADSGFVPQVGYRQIYADAGYTIRPKGFLRRQRFFATLDRQTDRDGGLLQQLFDVGTGMDAKLNSFLQFRFHHDRILAGPGVLSRAYGNALVQTSPSQLLNNLSLEARFGQEIDFANSRRGHGATITFSASLRPTDNLALSLNDSLRFLNVDAGPLASARLFTARVDRLRATYTFTARSFVRAIVQYIETKRDPALYEGTVSARSRSLSGSLLFAYKLNWQTVLFLGYGDDRQPNERDALEPIARSLFVKISYALQR
ncbi:MAG: carbohydrate binding family 9 domain-containing protein [Vicinamibacteria bacterium]|nr:carbohydrate binding family 9 domain-containing protein [Vicinamibacteria bacterium]